MARKENLAQKPDFTSYLRHSEDSVLAAVDQFQRKSDSAATDVSISAEIYASRFSAQ